MNWCPRNRANLFVPPPFLEKKNEDLLLSFLHLVCLLAVEIPVSEALWGQLSHPYILLEDHHVCPHICSEELRSETQTPLPFLGNGAFSRVRVVSLKETSGGVPARRNWGHIFVPYSEKAFPKAESSGVQGMGDEVGFGLN